MTGTGVRAVIPMKPLAQCKLRLAPLLDAGQRAQVALSMLECVAGAAQAAGGVAEVVVLGGDSMVQALCRRLGVGWQEDGAGSLNSALQTVYAGGWDPASGGMLYLAGDLPALQTADVEGLLAAFDGHDLLFGAGARGGTNAILLRRGLPFRFELGERSLQRHELQAETLGLRWRSYEAPAIHDDLDTPADVARLQHERPDLWLALLQMEEPPIEAQRAPERG